MQKLSRFLTVVSVLLAWLFVSCSDSSSSSESTGAEEPVLYSVTVEETENGKVSVDPAAAEENATVTLKVTPDEGFKLESLVVTDVDDNTVPVSDDSFTMPASDVKVIATFKATASDKNDKTTDVDKSTDTNKPADVDKPTDTDKPADVDKPTDTDKPADTDKPTMYSVTVKDAENGKVGADPASAKEKATVKLTVTPDEGYELESIAVTGSDGKTVPVSDNAFVMPASDVTVAATFKALPPTSANYVVKHLLQNASDDDYALEEKETKAGPIGSETEAVAKTYDGFTVQEFSQATIAETGTEVEIKYNRKTFTVAFNTDGGNDVPSLTVRYKATASEPTAPTKDATSSVAYTFEGWFNGDDAFDFATPITADITLKAKWSETAVLLDGSIGYTTTEVNKSTNDAAFTNTLTKTGDGAVAYTSDNTAVATVDKATGEVSIVGAGTATITATVTDSDAFTYATKTASYKITVTQATILSGMFKNGAVITVYFDWRCIDAEDYVSGTYDGSAFTASVGGDYWGSDRRAVYKVEKNGNKVTIGAGYYDYRFEGMTFTLDADTDSYTVAYGDIAQDMNNDEPGCYDIASIKLNGKDITSQLTRN